MMQCIRQGSDLVGFRKVDDVFVRLLLCIDASLRALYRQRKCIQNNEAVALDLALRPDRLSCHTCSTMEATASDVYDPCKPCGG